MSAPHHAGLRVVHQGELSPLQKRIASMLAMGLRQFQIAAALGMTPDAVKRHVEKIRDWQAYEALKRAEEP